jgi:hypothetical protein
MKEIALKRPSRSGKKRRTEMDKAKLNPLALGGAAAILAAIIMLALGILGNMGIFTGAVDMMQQWHVFFSPSIVGIIAGIIEAAVITFVSVYLFGLIYNKFA